jgi:hypothetical protein
LLKFEKKTTIKKYLMRQITLRNFSILLFFMLLISSCIEEDYDLENISDDIVLRDMTLAFPVGQIENTLEDIVNQINADEIMAADGMVYFIYKDSMTFETENIPSVLPFVSTENFQTASGTQFLLTATHDVSLSSSTSRIDSLLVKNSRIKIDVHSTLSENAQFEVKLPDGMSFANPAEAVFSVSLGTTTRYLDIQDNSVAKIQQLPTPSIEIEYILTTENSITIDNDDVVVDFQFETLNPQILWGYFPDISPTVKNNTVDINFFDKMVPQGSMFYFHNPIISCKAKNYVGIPSTFHINYVRASDNEGNEVEAVFNHVPSNTYDFVLNAPSEVYQYAETLENFDRENGGTHQLFQIKPRSISYQFTTSPVVNSGDNHFLIIDKYIDVILDIKLPLHFDEGSYLSTNDTLDLDLTEEDLGDMLKEAVLRINYSNLLAAKGMLDAFFLDENKNVIPSLTKTFELKASPVDALGNPTEEVKGSLYVKLNENDFEEITQVKYLLLKSKVAARTDNDKINIRASDYVKLKADLFVRGDVK